MAKSSKSTAAVHVGLSKQARRCVNEIRSQWSVHEAHHRRKVATLLQRQLAFLACIANG